MWTDDPVRDEAAYTLQQEIKYERWLATRPRCLICGEHIGDEEAIDFSECMEEGYVYHASCLWDALKFGRLNMTRGEELYDLISDRFLRRGE